MIYFICLISLLLPAIVSANDSDPAAHPDSMAKTVTAMPPSLEKVDALNELAWVLFTVDLSRYEDTSREALELAKSLEYERGMAFAESHLGFALSQSGDEAAGLKFVYAAKNRAEKLQDDEVIAWCLLVEGAMVDLNGELEEALALYTKSYDLYVKLGNLKGQAYVLNNFGAVYGNMDPPQLEKSTDYFRRNLALSKQIKSDRDIGFIAGNLASNFLEMGMADSAFYYYNLAIDITKKTGEFEMLSAHLNGLAAFYINGGDYKKALKLATQSYQMADSLQSPYRTLAASAALYRIYSSLENPTKALQYLERYNELLEQTLNESKIKEIGQIQKRFALERKQVEIDLLEKERAVQQLELERKNGLILGALLVAILLSALAFIFFRGRQKQQKLNAVLKEQNELIAKQKEEIEHTLLEVALERDKSDRLLRNILPESTARELKEKGFTATRRYDKVTVLFTDFKGFTQIAAKMEPEEVVENLNYCFTAFDRITRKYHLEKIKTIGDAYMCAGGLPDTDTADDNPIRMVMAAREMIAFMQEWKAKKASEGVEVWDLRLGIHTGPVVAGVVGEDKFAYDIWGDTVNTASRMESSGEPSKINISESTYVFVKDTFNCTPRGRIEAKNKGEIDMYFVG